MSDSADLHRSFNMHRMSVRFSSAACCVRGGLDSLHCSPDFEALLALLGVCRPAPQQAPHGRVQEIGFCKLDCSRNVHYVECHSEGFYTAPSRAVLYLLLARQQCLRRELVECTTRLRQRR